MHRRTLLASAGAIAAVGRIGKANADTPGVTATEIKIGNTMPYSGPASAYGAIGRGLTAYFKRLNEQGGVAGRQINFMSLDDGYAPPRTVEQTRRLVEQEGVAFMLNQLGTPTNTAVQRYLNQKKVPQMFVATGADKWGNYKEYPWTIGWQPSYRTEARIYAKYVLANKPQAKIGTLFQNDDFGKDYVIGLREGLGDKQADMIVKEVSYEVTDPTIDSQVVTLQSSGVDVLLTAATPKFAAQTIHKIFDLGWKPLHLMTNVSISVGAVLTPAGPDRAIGMITAAYGKDPTDPSWNDDAGMKEWRAFMAKYMPEADTTDAGYEVAYSVGQTAEQVLKQCNGDFSRQNLMGQATNLRDLHCATLLPGITVNTSPTNYHPIRQEQMAKWTGKNWALFGEVIQDTQA